MSFSQIILLGVAVVMFCLHRLRDVQAGEVLDGLLPHHPRRSSSRWGSPGATSARTWRRSSTAASTSSASSSVRSIGCSAPSPEHEQTWKRYAGAMVVFSAVSIAFTYVILRIQGSLPLNPQHFGARRVRRSASTRRRRS